MRSLVAKKDVVLVDSVGSVRHPHCPVDLKGSARSHTLSSALKNYFVRQKIKIKKGKKPSWLLLK